MPIMNSLFISFGTNGCICNGGVIACTDLYEN
jgi:predicted outer membrane repeat protein